MIKLVIVSLAILAVSDCGARADEIQGVDGFSAEEVAKIKKLLPELVKIGEIMERKIPKDFKPEKGMLVAQDELDKLNSRGCIQACWTKKTLKKALELFVSLKSSLGYCDSESFQIVAKISLALQDADMTVPTVRIEQVASHFLELHASRCRPIYKQKYTEQVRLVCEKDLAKIEQAFGELTVAYFIPKHERGMFRTYRYDLVGMSEPRFTSIVYRRALQEISERIMAQLKDTPKKVLTERENVGTFNREDLKNVLDEYLFEPCENYRAKLGSLLTEARLYAAPNDGEAQADYIRGNKKFHHALINNRLCKSLLEGRGQLYEPFFEVWNKVLRSPDDTDY